jgi:hypothetical protein
VTARPSGGPVSTRRRACLVATLAWVLWLVAAPALAQGVPTVSEPPAAATGQPVETEGPVLGSGDSRSDGGGPGLVGSPVAIALGVVVLGVITAVGTLVVLRVTGTRRE